MLPRSVAGRSSLTSSRYPTRPGRHVGRRRTLRPSVRGSLAGGFVCRGGHVAAPLCDHLVRCWDSGTCTPTAAPEPAVGPGALEPGVVPKMTRGSPLGQQLLRGPHHAVRLEAELPLELLERGRGPERLHANDTARLADVALPAQGRRLLHCDACFYPGR